MKQEIEVKAKLDSLSQVEKKLSSLGAELTSEKEQIDTYFGELSLYKKLGYSFMTRVREAGDKITLNFKSSKEKKSGICEESEIEISDAEIAREMMSAMGLDQFLVVNKQRKRYQLDDMEICLDKVKNLGDFIEVERMSNGNSDKVQEELVNFIGRLGISPEEIIKNSYIYLILKNKKSPYFKYSY